MSKDIFFKVYANLPLGVRREVVLTLSERGPITWEVAYQEIKANTDLGQDILKKLFELEIIKSE